MTNWSYTVFDNCKSDFWINHAKTKLCPAQQDKFTCAAVGVHFCISPVAGTENARFELFELRCQWQGPAKTGVCKTIYAPATIR